MKYNPEIHHRRTIRLTGYDYSSYGAYFVTICTRNRECLFGDVIGGEMILNSSGIIARKCSLEIPLYFPDVELGEYMVMPNHIHGIIIITNGNDKQFCRGLINQTPTRANWILMRNPKRTLGKIIRN